ncbi:EF-P 5-aminopentanol modification-associated protein YfmF [Alkalicoccus daliensis]|uniref:Predicted Zn-dependent peptidase n=1 Tax=Alkalicoccus daliensis TaxID=745820 RepID=A0A1H0A8S4_9BACI|nr:pitrilysin family protein [Alkalicoccus daliensis]SDN29875.1 Predicted Zn-dependent peptidase [Alkalicoccus daliensis]
MNQATIHSIRTHVMPVDSFKTNTFILQLRTELSSSDITEKALLPSILERGTQHFPSRLHIQGALEELYGAHLSADVVKKGEHHILTFRLEVANEKFLKDAAPLTERAVQLLSSIFLYPALENESFPAQAVAEEVRSHKQKIASVYDDKMRFANKRLTEEMCKDEPYAVPVLGYEQDLPKVTGKSLYKAYKKLLQESHVDLYVIGDIQEEELLGHIEKYMRLEDNNPVPVKVMEKKAASAPNIIKEQQQVQQAKLHIGYRTGITFGDEQYFPLQVFNSLFGGSPHSKLFVNVREKASLAYYAASRLESHKGIMIVMAGIDSAKFDEASSIIDQQLEDMKNGDFTEEDIEQTKAVLINQILETIDVPRGRVELEYHGSIIGEEWTAEKWIEKIKKVTKDEIISAAKQVEKDTVYFLSGKEEQANA